jgi:2-hydroxycyclohexanecarboxyl-CoA dehydrogenase
MVVTGGASGIGAACVRRFTERGDRVVVWDLVPPGGSDPVSPSPSSGSEERTKMPSAGEADETAASTGRREAEAAWIVDITDYAAVQHATERVERELGPIEGVVHAAAIGSGKYGVPFTELHPDDWRKVLEVNIMGTTHVAHATAPPMRARRRGVYAMISSVAGQIGSPTDPPYSASKAAMINFAQVMARDLAPHGVRVNTVCPGMVQTPLNRSVWAAWNARQPADQKRAYRDWAGDKVQQVIPLQRWQQPEDIASMVDFLCSEAASEVTGQTINVDGGFVMHR